MREDKRHLGIDFSNKFDVSALDLHYLCIHNTADRFVARMRMREESPGNTERHTS